MLVDAPRFKYLPIFSNFTSINYSTPITEGYYAGGSQNGFVGCNSPGVNPNFCPLQKGLAKLTGLRPIDRDSFTEDEINNAFSELSVSVTTFQMQLLGRNDHFICTDAVGVSCEVSGRDVMEQLSIKQEGTANSIFEKGKVIFARIDTD